MRRIYHMLAVRRSRAGRRSRMKSTRRAFVLSCAVGAPLLVVSRVDASSVRFESFDRGTCSFCHGEEPSRALAGVVGRPTRICDGCILLALDLWDVLVGSRRKSSLVIAFEELSAGVEDFRKRSDELFGELTPEEEAQCRAAVEKRRSEVGKPKPPPPPAPMLRCWFCDETNGDERRMIAGPSAFACERCVIAATRVLWDAIEV
jgi:hypothetical protein